MAVYVAEISGQGIVAFDAASDDEARVRLADKALQRDLYVFQHEGRALWDGVSEANAVQADFAPNGAGNDPSARGSRTG